MTNLKRCARCRAIIEPGARTTRCRACGAALAVDATSALLFKLSQLARFGLAAEDPPLLEPVSEE